MSNADEAFFFLSFGAQILPCQDRVLCCQTMGISAMHTTDGQTPRSDSRLRRATGYLQIQMGLSMRAGTTDPSAALRLRRPRVLGLNPPSPMCLLRCYSFVMPSDMPVCGLPSLILISAMSDIAAVELGAQLSDLRRHLTSTEFISRASRSRSGVQKPESRCTKVEAI